MLLLHGALLLTLLAGVISAQKEARSPDVPTADTRAAVPPKNLDTTCSFPGIHDLTQWEARRNRIRQQILVSCGLYPLPPKPPLRARIFGRIQRDGYSIEKVYFQTYPGFYLAGNLYRPSGHSGAGRAKSLHPGVLIAHGHWDAGRMADTSTGSIPARAITFARQGYVAFSYDMVGYNDTRQIPEHRTFANDRKHWLWGVSLMGLQTWNSIRALDFLSSLPDVDKKRLAITGESGGGTQTMLLGAIDDRLAAVGPCVMVSHTMQGGCLCENAPGLRVDFSNMEIAACAAPRPQIMVGATGDWTKTMMTLEGPAVESVYRLYADDKKPDPLRYVIFDYGHNINKTSREAVYAWFGKWLLDEQDESKLKEPAYHMDPAAVLRVFPDGAPLPKDALTAEGLTDSLILLGQTEIARRKPHDRRSLTLFQKLYTPAWERTLQLDNPPEGPLADAQSPEPVAGGTLTRLRIGRPGRGDSILAALFLPAGSAHGPAAILAHPEGRVALMDMATGAPGPLVAALLAHGRAALLLDAFLTGERADPTASAARQRPFGEFFTTYNRTDLQERVQDLVTCCWYLRKRESASSVTLVGLDRAGLWALLAAPAADAAAADCARLDLTSDDALLSDELFVPCLRRLGDFHTAAVLAAPHRLLLHNTGEKFPSAAWIQEVYGAIGAAASFRSIPEPATSESLVDWITAEKK